LIKHRIATLSIAAALLTAPAFSQGIGGFEGPSVLSRGAGQIGNRSGRAVGIRFFAGINGVYDDGLVPVSLDSNGNIPSIGGLYGVEASLGAYGSKTFRRGQLGIDYKGSYRHYSQKTFYDGSDHSLQLGYSQQPSKRLQVNYRAIGTSTSRGLGAYSTVAVADTTAILGPAALLFDNRVNALQGGVDIAYQKSARLSFQAGGDGYTVRRQSQALVGVNGYSINGGLAYQYSKSMAFNVVYTHTHYDFPRAFGESAIDGIEIGVNRRLTRRWSIGLSGGGYFAQSEGLKRVGLDPVIAALLGTGSIIQGFYRETTLPSYNGALTGKYKLFSVQVSASRSVTPGNGVYLASASENYQAGYSYTGLRKASFGVSGGYSKLGSIGQSLSGYGQYTGGVNGNYNVMKYVSITARYDYRQSIIDLVGYNRKANRFTLGFTFSPAEIPFSWF